MNKRFTLFSHLALYLVILVLPNLIYSQNYFLGYSPATNNSTISTNSGTFYDSGSGGRGRYSNNEDVTVTFCTTDGGYMQLDFTSFNLENGFDYLYIYDGSSVTSPLIGAYSGSSSGTITATGTCLTVRFISDRNVKRSGWEASISSIAPIGDSEYILGTNPATNNSTITTCSGTFYDSGRSGGNYSSYENTTVTFCAEDDSVMQIDFTSFDLENGYDFMYIYDGSSTSSTLIGTYSSSSPGTITATGSCLTIRFDSDFSVTRSGWEANITCVAPLPETYILGTSPATNNSTINTCSGTFYDSGANGSNYSNYENTTVTFCSDDGSNIEVDFTSFDLENGYDYMYIYDGASTSATYLGAYSRSSPGTITASGSCLTFRFDSDFSVTRSGWEATISCIPNIPDADNDGVADSVDSDDDNDGIPDEEEWAVDYVNLSTSENTSFPIGYWSILYYEGTNAISGSIWGANSGNGGTGSAQYRGASYDGLNDSILVFSNSWTAAQTPTSPSAPTNYVGTTWSSSGNPWYEIQFRRRSRGAGTLTFGSDVSDNVDDAIEVYVNGTREYAYFPSGGAPDPRPGGGVTATVNYNANDEIAIVFINLGGPGGLSYTFEMTGEDPSNTDTDLDGIPNVQDLDSDNDGISDLIEAGGIDADGDGHIDYPIAGDPSSMTDLDGDGMSDDLVVDTNGDGTADLPADADTSDPNNSGTNLPLPNSDGTGNNDYKDIDSDDDGIIDLIEGQSTSGFSALSSVDTDDDGLDDNFDGDDQTTVGISGGAGSAVVPYDANGDGTPDYMTNNSDDDSRSDMLEAYDTDLDGVLNPSPQGIDSDGDGLDDAFDYITIFDGSINVPLLGLNISNSFDIVTLGILSNISNANNNGQTPTSFPDITPGETGGDRDWRESSVVLPVEWLSFDVTVESNGGHHLNWVVGSEINVKEYDIQMSNDGNVFQSIGITKAEGGLYPTQSYDYTNTYPPTGMVYYRIKQQDFDGAFSYSRAIMVNEGGTATSPKLEVYPNPADNIINVRGHFLRDHTYMVELLDINGRGLWSDSSVQFGEENVSINVNHIPSGMYFLRVMDTENNLFTYEKLEIIH